MGTFFWNDIVFGPFKSRRVGNSLGINISPIGGKVCTFDCVYCEIGWNKDGVSNTHIPTLDEISSALEERFRILAEAGEKIDSISFTGNGEPTLHPEFGKIIDRTLELRDRFFKGAVVSVFTNSTQLFRPEIREALSKVDNPILKLDTMNPSLFAKINRPTMPVSPSDVVSWMKDYGHNFIIQTMFFKGTLPDGTVIDNAADAKEWQDAVLEIMPREVMLYTIDRDTPEAGLSKTSVEEMKKVASPLEAAGIKIQIKG